MQEGIQYEGKGGGEKGAKVIIKSSYTNRQYRDYLSGDDAMKLTSFPGFHSQEPGNEANIAERSPWWR